MGQEYIYAIVLALSDEVVRTTVAQLQSKEGGVLGTEPLDTIFDVVFPDQMGNCEYSSSDFGIAAGEESRTIVEELIQQTKEAVDIYLELYKIVLKYDLQTAWEIAPLLNGNAVKEVRHFASSKPNFLFTFFILLIAPQKSATRPKSISGYNL